MNKLLICVKPILNCRKGQLFEVCEINELTDHFKIKINNVETWVSAVNFEIFNSSTECTICSTKQPFKICKRCNNITLKSGVMYNNHHAKHYPYLIQCQLSYFDKYLKPVGPSNKVVDWSILNRMMTWETS